MEPLIWTCIRRVFLLALVQQQLLLVAPWQGGAAARALNFTRRDFPSDFVFGAGTSAYQLRKHTSTRGQPMRMEGGQVFGTLLLTKEDVELMTDTGLEAYRFSISWSWLIPKGRGAINQKGLEYYNNLINELVKQGIEIHVTLYHFDLPQILEDEYLGWLSPRVVEDFTAYADVCFREFGDRVKHWTAMDEPNVACLGAYDIGIIPPGRCSTPFGTGCTAGNSTVEPYIAMHNFILAHASVANLYREKYKATQKGVIGTNIYSYWSYLFSPRPADVAAAQRSLDFMFGWKVNPLVFGDYREIIKKRIGSRLPSFTKGQSKMIRGSADFIGINHYISAYVSDGSKSNDTETVPRDFITDMSVGFRYSRNDPPTCQLVPNSSLSNAQGLQYLLEYLSDTYKNVPVYVQENGYGELLNDSIYDHKRVEYLSGYIGSTLAALRNGANVKGYFVWSFLDVFELLAGYHSRFGLQLR